VKQSSKGGRREIRDIGSTDPPPEFHLLEAKSDQLRKNGGMVHSQIEVCEKGLEVGNAGITTFDGLHDVRLR